MRHPVSTPRCLEQRLSRAMLGRVVGFSISPRTPDDAQPGAREDAYGVGMITAAGSCLGIDVRGPGVGVARVIGQAGERGAQAVSAGPAEGNGLGSARLVGD